MEVHVSAAITIADLTFSYPTPLPDEESTPALRHINLTIEQGQFVALVGPIGAGKTTLCLCLNGLAPQTTGGEFHGEACIHGLNSTRSPVADIARFVGMVFEDAEVQLFNASAEDEIAFGLEELGWAPADIETRIDWALERVGLSGLRHRSPRTLSGGEQKRLAIATVLATAPPILVLDEPTAGLDPRGKQEVMDVIDRLAQERQATVIMASQDPEIVARYAERIIFLHQGQIRFDGQPSAFYARLARDTETCIGLPQMAEVAQILSQPFPDLPPFLSVDAARQAIGDALKARGEKH
jgi:energy-coupling factor transporter ATP-binding protein EcfA2